MGVFIMKNFTTNVEYQGGNIDALIEAGFDENSEFCTFKQAVAYFNLTGKELKGAKSCAVLKKIVEKKEFNKLSNKMEKKKVPVNFYVFEKNHLIDTLRNNGVEGV